MSTPADCVQHQSSANAGCRGCEPLDGRLGTGRGPGVFGAVSSAILLFVSAGNAHAQTPAPAPAAAPAPAPAKPKTGTDSLPGTPRPKGPSLAPDAPPVPPAPGGRAPSFGAPTDPDVWSFRLGGKISAYEPVGIGTRENPGENSSTTLHVPSRTDGRLPFGPGAQLTLNFSYGTAIVGAFVNYTVNSVGKEYSTYYQATAGAAANSAYLAITPNPLGRLKLQMKVGAFTDNFAGTGQWGWGLLGPLIGIRGYGESITGEYDLTPDLRLFVQHGLFAVPGVPEFFVRGTFSGWNETGVSTVLQHAHVGLSYKGKYVVKLHAVNAAGTEERKFLGPPEYPFTNNPGDYEHNNEDCPADNPGCHNVPRDGRMDALAVETHTFLDQWGQFGLSAAYYRMVTANPIHDGFWWTVDWTQGARETRDKYLGPQSNGTGSFFAISAQYDFSLASVLWHPQPFNGRGPDVRIALAGLYHKTLDTEDPGYSDAYGYQFGLDVEYRMLPWLSSTLRSFGTIRNPSYRPIVNSAPGTQYGGAGLGDYTTVTITPGLIFRSDWQAPERIEIAYSRFIYSDFVTANPNDPRDENVVTVGASVSF